MKNLFSIKTNCVLKYLRTSPQNGGKKMIPVYFYEDLYKVRGHVDVEEFLNSDTHVTVKINNRKQNVDKKVLVVSNMASFQNTQLKKAN
jgi:hypothetical protein